MKKEDLQEQINDPQRKLDKMPDEVKFEVGKWYISTDKSIFFAQKIGSVFKTKGYGIHKDIGWCSGEGYFYLSKKTDREATDEEVKRALVKEAKRRGFAWGNFKCVIDGTVWRLGSSETTYSLYRTQLKTQLSIRGACCFNDGKWATILDEPIVIKTEDEEYEVKFTDEGITIGCEKMSLTTLKNLLTWDGINKSGKKQIKQILERL